MTKNSKNTQNLLSIVIPARNEQKTIVKTLNKLINGVSTSNQIVVVNDQSVDDTEKVVNTLIKSHQNIRIINTSLNESGFANAIKLGISYSKGKYIIIVMADLCDDIKSIDLMYKKINEGWDIVCGSRYMKGGKKIGGPKFQGFMSKVVCSSLQFVTGIRTSDVSNAFKMYRKELINKLSFPDGGVEVSMYLALQAHFIGAKICEVPTIWKGRTLGVSKFKLAERTPKYSGIYFWAVKNTFKRHFGNKI